jgi:hypothetical protein
VHAKPSKDSNIEAAEKYSKKEKKIEKITNHEETPVNKRHTSTK